MAIQYPMFPSAWVDLGAIKEIYKEIERLVEQDGKDRDVHHIVPLISKLVCGLHCEDNLMIIDRLANQSINNRWWPDMP